MAEGSRKQKVVEEHAEKSGFTGCIGFIDGSLLGLHAKPLHNSERFYNRKKRYMISSTVVCDYNLRIIYAQVGDYGTIHDARALREGYLYKNVTKLFSKGQFILGDGAYPTKSWLLPVKRNHRRNPLTGSDIKFNKCISRMRVRIENCFAALKGRFPSVEELRISIKNTKKDVNRANNWVLACCILHNFCLQHDTNTTLEYFSDVFLREHPKIQERINRITASNYLDDYADEDGDENDLLTNNDVDLTDAGGKRAWQQQKRIVLEDYLGKDIDELDRKYANRHQIHKDI